jgi:hypothetical protein
VKNELVASGLYNAGGYDFLKETKRFEAAGESLLHHFGVIDVDGQCHVIDMFGLHHKTEDAARAWIDVGGNGEVDDVLVKFEHKRIGDDGVVCDSGHDGFSLRDCEGIMVERDGDFGPGRKLGVATLGLPLVGRIVIQPVAAVFAVLFFAAFFAFFSFFAAVTHGARLLLKSVARRASGCNKTTKKLFLTLRPEASIRMRLRPYVAEMLPYFASS